MKRSMSVILGALALMITVGCIWQYRKGDRDASCTKQLFAMDTVMSFTAYGPKAEEAVDAAMKEIERLDALLSTGNESSEISQLNAAGSFLISEETLKLLEEAESIRQSTGGLFDVTVYPLMQLWGFPTGDYRVPTKEEISNTLSLVDAAQIQIEGAQVTLGSGQQVDLGGIAKGYASDRVMELYREYGVTSGMVSLGGNIETLGTKPDGTDWKIGIRNPEIAAASDIGSGTEDVLLALEVENRAVITSGGYERYFEEDGRTYIHIIDPRTGYPVENDLLSVTIVSPDGTLADGLSTALYIMGYDKAVQFWEQHQDEFDVILITADEQIHVSKKLQDSFQSDKNWETIE